MKPMDDVTFQSVVASRIGSMVDYVESDVGPERQRATRYYLGDVSDKLPAVTGRSSVVSRDLRDTVNDIMPSLLRIFMKPKAVEFDPFGPEDEEAAKQATDYVNYVLWHDNDGFRTLHSAIKDALVRKVGIVKCWWDESECVTSRTFQGLDDETYTAVIGEVDMSEAEVIEHSVEQTDAGPLHSVTIQRRKKKSKVCVEALPLEEFAIDSEAKSITDCIGVAHICEKRVGELVAMGYDQEQMLELAGSSDDVDAQEERQARNPNRSLDLDDGEDGDPSMRKVRYVEAYLRMDADGDGIIEWRKVCTAGVAYKVLSQEMVDDHPFADIAMEPEPHRFLGESLFDILCDIQLINSQLLRLALDGLSQVVTPRYVVAKNAGVDIKQLLDNRVGGVILADRADGVTPLMTDKTAPQMALEAYRAMKDLRSERTGQSAASMGLAPDALQSVSRIAANEVVQKAQGRVEMIARVMAEGGFRRMFRLILKLVTQYQDKERTVRLRNKWVKMDPRTWNPDMDVRVNVGLGNGAPEEKGMFLNTFLQVQQAIMQQGGPNNPWVGTEEIRNALESLCEVAGETPERYVIPAEKWQQIQQQMAQQPPKPPPPDPAMEMIQVEREKAQAKAQLEQQDQAFKQQTEVAKDDRERDKLEADIVMRAMKEFGVDPNAVLAFIRQPRSMQ